MKTITKVVIGVTTAATTVAALASYFAFKKDKYKVLRKKPTDKDMLKYLEHKYGKQYEFIGKEENQYMFTDGENKFPIDIIDNNDGTYLLDDSFENIFMTKLINEKITELVPEITFVKSFVNLDEFGDKSSHSYKELIQNGDKEYFENRLQSASILIESVVDNSKRDDETYLEHLDKLQEYINTCGSQDIIMYIDYKENNRHKETKVIKNDTK